MIFPNKEERLAILVGKLSDENENLLKEFEYLKNVERWVQQSKDKIADIQEQIKKLGADVPK